MSFETEIWRKNMIKKTNDFTFFIAYPTTKMHCVNLECFNLSQMQTFVIRGIRKSKFLDVEFICREIYRSLYRGYFNVTEELESYYFLYDNFCWNP